MPSDITRRCRSVERVQCFSRRRADIWLERGQRLSFTCPSALTLCLKSVISFIVKRESNWPKRLSKVYVTIFVVRNLNAPGKTFRDLVRSLFIEWQFGRLMCVCVFFFCDTFGLDIPKAEMKNLFFLWKPTHTPTPIEFGHEFIILLFVSGFILRPQFQSTKYSYNYFRPDRPSVSVSRCTSSLHGFNYTLASRKFHKIFCAYSKIKVYNKKSCKLHALIIESTSHIVCDIFPILWVTMKREENGFSSFKVGENYRWKFEEVRTFCKDSSFVPV